MVSTENVGRFIPSDEQLANPPDDDPVRTWQLIQSCYDFPVDRHGQPINPKDQITLRAWRAAGVHRFVKQ